MLQILNLKYKTKNDENELFGVLITNVTYEMKKN
jgi:hypothetical protein